MAKDKDRIKVAMELDTLQSKAMQIHEKHTINYQGCHFWDNKDVSPENSNIPSETKTKFHLKQAKDNETLEKVESYHEPLAFTSNSDKIKLRCWDIGKISFLSRDGSSVEARDHNEFEVWIQANSYESRMNKIIDEIREL